MSRIKQFNTLLEEGLSKSIFDHLRNYLMCSLLLAIGITELRQSSHQFLSFIPVNYSGVGVTGLALLLISLNLYDGVRKISKSRYHVLLTTVLVIIYLFMSIRVIELAWTFRAS